MPSRKYQPTHRLEKRRWVRRVMRGVARSTLSIFAAGSFAALVALGVGPRTGLYRTLTVLSGSMTPGIPVGSVLIDTPEKPSDIRVGQIVTYQVPVLDHHVVSHRVVNVVSPGARPAFQTKGDANAAPDPWTAQTDGSSLWRVRAVVPWAGWAILALRKPVVHRVLVWVFPAVLGLVWVLNIWRKPVTRTRPAAGRAGVGLLRET